MALRSFLVDPEFWRTLKHIAVERDTTVSAIIREALADWIERHAAA